MQSLRILCVLIAGLILSACLPVTTKTPLGTTKPQVEDAQLRGNWNATSPKKEDKGTAYFHFLSTPAADDGGKMWAILISPRSKAEEAELSIYSATPVRLGKHRYLNARFMADGGKEDDKVFPVLYTIRKGTLALYLLDEKKTAEAVKAGRIAGDVKEDSSKNVDVMLTADGPALDAFFATDEGAALFTEKVFVPFHRLP